MLQIADTGGTRAFENDLRRKRIGFHVQVRTPAGGLQVGHRSRATPALSRRQLVVADPLLVTAIEIVDGTHTHLIRYGDERVNELMTLLDRGGPERSVDAARRRRTQFIVFEPPEVRQALLPAPAPVSQCTPVIVVIFLAAHIDQTVDRTAATQRASTRPVQLTIIQDRKSTHL